MEPRPARKLLVVGLALALVGVVVPGFYHIRCEAILASDSDAGMESPCVETFPAAIAVGAASVGIFASFVVLSTAMRAVRVGDPDGPRALVTLAAITLAIPALILVAAWASAGFDFRFAEADGSCHSSTPWRSPPFWLQHSMCVDAFDLVRVPALALAGLAAALGARTLDTRALLLGVGAGAVAIASVALAIALGAARLGLVWTLPVLGTLVLALGAWLARRQAQGQPEMAAA